MMALKSTITSCNLSGVLHSSGSKATSKRPFKDSISEPTIFSVTKTSLMISLHREIGVLERWSTGFRNK
jgi:hypothetical protein